MNKITSRRKWLIGIAIATVIVLTLISAPNNNQLTSGSTFNRSPNGYGAWYAFMQERGAKIQRWQRPLDNLLEKHTNKTTLLQVNVEPGSDGISSKLAAWLDRGNRLIILGVRSPTTEAPFSSSIPSFAGNVKIETKRRNTGLNKSNYNYEGEQLASIAGSDRLLLSQNIDNSIAPIAVKGQAKSLLHDEFGSLAWQQTYDRGGKIIYIVPNYLAANAYQDDPGNFEFLAKLVTQSSNSIFVDEYMHGYKEKDVEAEGEKDLLLYFARTPLFPALCQVIFILLLLFWAQNRRFGAAQTPEIKSIDNSLAYINALASVLRKAESSEFVIEAIGRSELNQLQKNLGLGQTPVEQEVLLKSWELQTGRSPAELQELLQLQTQKPKIREQELLNWLIKWQKINIKT